ncbi:TNT domain-containing protein [Cellulomonas cellasea]|uniref:TNT domain-containing protein n=1 Tax=Cellulomonas cellasea TaxID=43670 RepID=UPI0025A4761F|nr:TNT domain-containing protein [Cellulomonas cellasea]MDM8084224.1 TNT domain-containing protein [Cellulomonas cellasea]
MRGAVPGTKIVFEDPTLFAEMFGTELDRVGEPGGSFLGVPPGTPWAQRSLTPDTLGSAVHQYTLDATASARHGVTIQVSQVAEAFAQPGGGIQVQFLQHGGRVSVSEMSGTRGAVVIDLDESLKSLLEEGGDRYRTVDGAPFWGSSEAGYVLTDNGALFDVSYWSRGRTKAPELVGAASLVVQVYLTISLGNDWRSVHGMRLLRISTPDAILPPGFEVREVPESGRVELRILRDPEIVLGELRDRRKAIGLARALAVPFDSLIASYRHPDGLPAFPHG